MDKQQMNEVLDIISQAWGPSDNTGYCFFPWIDRREQSDGKTGFHSVAFEWPAERDEVVDHMLKHQHHDLYWCPVIFDDQYRQEGMAHEEYSLWADLDEVDPHRIEDEWRPTIAYETSPGRYQALWLLKDPDNEDLYGAARQTGENRLMTHMLGADPSGWDITQLLRIPGWHNHKKDYTGRGGRYPEGKLLWQDGPKYDAVDFNKLPPLPKGFHVVEFDDDLRAEIEDVDRSELAKRIGPLLPKRAQTLLKAKSVNGDDRSKTLWYLVQCLAEVDCTVAEIIAMVRPTIWNKFDGRADELRRLGADAAAAVSSYEEKSADAPLPVKQSWAEGMAEVKKPIWLIPGVMVEGSVGFIAGEPKTRKSWIGLDLAFSVAMAGDGHAVKFLNHFPVNNGGPVLYMILEDALSIVKDRGEKIWASKYETAWGMRLEDGALTYGRDYLGKSPTPSVDFIGDCIVHLSDARGRDWLATALGEGKVGTGRPYRMLIIDTLMRSAGDVDENKSLDLMNRLLGPLTGVARRHKLNIVVIHHFKKASANGPTRGGQRMLGSQAFHAWAEDSIYVTADHDRLIFDVESKSAESTTHTFTLASSRRLWLPTHTTETGSKSLDFAGVDRPNKPGPRPSGKVLTVLTDTPATIAQVATAADLTYHNARNQLIRAQQRDEAIQIDGKWVKSP